MENKPSSEVLGGNRGIWERIEVVMHYIDMCFKWTDLQNVNKYVFAGQCLIEVIIWMFTM